jgi:hypothetical protein
MRITYSSATGVIAWIGKSSGHNSQAIAALKRIPATTSSSARDTIWEELESLFASPYWKRIWIIQEIVVTAKISFVALTSLPGVKWKPQTKPMNSAQLKWRLTKLLIHPKLFKLPKETP